MDIPTTGIILGDASRWLRQKWQPEVSVLLLADPPRSPRGWSVALRGSPKPLAPAVARAAAGAAAVSKDDEWSIREIAERLLEEEQAVANLRVLASEPANKRVVLPYLAKAGDPGAAHELLVELRARLNAGEVPDREDVIWLDAVADPAELPWLFECLEQAAAKAERSPFGPFGPLQAAIARIDGEEAVRRYDDLLAREPFEGAQFLRSQRDGVLQDQLRAVGLKAARSVLAELSLPVLAP